MKLSLADLRALPSRTADHPPRLRRRLELHRQVEGRAARPRVLTAAGLKPQARLSLFTCADDARSRRSTAPAATTRRSTSIDAFHPQTILAYEMNDAPLAGRARRAAAAPGRAPARLQDGEVRHADRGDRQLRLARPRPRRLLGGPRLRVVRRDLSAGILRFSPWLRRHCHRSGTNVADREPRSPRSTRRRYGVLVSIAGRFKIASRRLTRITMRQISETTERTDIQSVAFERLVALRVHFRFGALHRNSRSRTRLRQGGGHGDGRTPRRQKGDACGPSCQNEKKAATTEFDLDLRRAP